MIKKYWKLILFFLILLAAWTLYSYRIGYNKACRDYNVGYWHDRGDAVPINIR